MASSLLEFVLSCFPCSRMQGKNVEGRAEKKRGGTRRRKESERAQVQGRSVLEKYFSVFTRCSRSVFLYVYGVLAGMGHNVLLVRWLRCLQR